MTREDQAIIYTSAGPFVLEERRRFRQIRMMLKELSGSRELVWQLFVRDFRARYRQSALGIFWALLMPIATVALFVLMNRSGIIVIPEHDLPYPLYALVGLSLWSFLVTAVTGASGALTGAGAMVVKINFPRIALVIAAILQAAVDFAVRILLIIALFGYYRYLPDPATGALAVLACVPLLLLTLALGCVLAICGVIFRDTPHLLNLAFSALMLLSPVLYPMPTGTLLARFNLWNPLNYLINVPRDLLLRGGVDELLPFALVSLLSGMALILAWRLFFVAQRKIAERM